MRALCITLDAGAMRRKASRYCTSSVKTAKNKGIQQMPLSHHGDAYTR